MYDRKNVNRNKSKDKQRKTGIQTDYGLSLALRRTDCLFDFWTTAGDAIGKLVDDIIFLFEVVIGEGVLLSAGFGDNSGGTIPDTEHDEARRSH